MLLLLTNSPLIQKDEKAMDALVLLVQGMKLCVQCGYDVITIITIGWSMVIKSLII